MITLTARRTTHRLAEPLTLWLAGRSRREQLLLGAATALCLVAIGWYGLILPTARLREDAVTRIALYEQLQARLRAAPAGGEVTTSAPPTPDAPIDATVQQVIASAELSAEVSGGPDQVDVTVSGARFEAAMALVQSLEGMGLAVQTLSLQGRSEGVVDLALTVSRA